MKSIQNQYIDLKEGRMSQANFMRNLRMTMPQYVTNVTSFNDAVRILKSKSILTERVKEPSEYAGFYDDPRFEEEGKWDAFYSYVNNEIQKISREENEPGLVSYYKENKKQLEKIVDSFFDNKYEENPPKAAAEAVLGKYIEDKEELMEDPIGQQIAGNPEEEAEYKSSLIKRKKSWIDLFNDELENRDLSFEEEDKALEAIDKLGPEKLKNMYGMLQAEYAVNAFLGDVDEILSNETLSEVNKGMGSLYDEIISVKKHSFGNCRNYGLLVKFEKDGEEGLMELCLKVTDYDFDTPDEYTRTGGVTILDFKVLGGNIQYGDNSISLTPELSSVIENDDQFLDQIQDTLADMLQDDLNQRDLENRMDEIAGLSEAKTKLTADQVNNDELRMGIRVEMEHTNDPEKAKKIALDHLAENPFYYTQLKLSGVDTKALPSKEKKAIAKKKDETLFVDKDNQMKLVKDVEKVKASANKSKKETNKPVKGVSLMSLVSKTVRGVKKMDATGEKMKKIKENKVASTIFDKNKSIEAGVNAIAKGEEPKQPETKSVEIKPKKSTEEKLREVIRKMIKQEMYDGRDNMTDVTGENN